MRDHTATPYEPALYGTADKALLKDAAFLAKSDPAIGRAMAALDGRPTFRRRPGGFEGLVRIIAEQQVSAPAGQAIVARLYDGLRPFTPERALAAQADGLRGLGLTRQKARYVLALAETIRDGAFDPEALTRLPDAEAAKALTDLYGIGRWSAAIYLLFCEGRRDIWPPHDVALMASYGIAAKIARPDNPAMEAAAQAWAPRRGAAAHILWSYNAVLKGRTPQ